VGHAYPGGEELTNHYFGPSCVSRCLLLLSLYSLSVSSFREECSANVPRPPTVHANLLDVMKIARSLIMTRRGHTDLITYYFACFRLLYTECSPRGYIVYYNGSHILGAGVTSNKS